MSRYRDHNCALWENFCVHSECLQFFENRVQELTHIARKVDKVWKELETFRLFVQEQQRVAEEFVNEIKGGFGKLPNNNDIGKNWIKMEKKIKATIEVLQSREEFVNVDVEKVIDGANK